MVAACLEIAILALKVLPATKFTAATPPNVFSEHQNASTADVLTGNGEFCKRL